MGAGRNACLSSSQIKLKRMKSLSSVLSILSLYLFLQAKTTLDLSFAFIVMMGAIIFILFMIIEEQRNDIAQLRRQVWEKDNMYTIKGGDGRTYVGYK
jgi:glycerol-3-phosphate acyltransferase PlsY